MEKSTLFFKGNWHKGVVESEIRNPFDNEVVGTMDEASPEQIQSALDHIGEGGSKLPRDTRAQILTDLAKVLQSREQEYAASIVREIGTPLKDALREVRRSVNFCMLVAEECLRAEGEVITLNDSIRNTEKYCLVTRRPVGCVFVITPFNRPLHQVIVKVAAAIAAGNSVVIKPSEKCPLTAAKLCADILSCGFPKDALVLLTGRPEKLVNQVLHSKKIDMVAFTGGLETGLKILPLIGLRHRIMELGDNGAAIIAKDANIIEAAKIVVAGAVSNAGQSCRGVKRIIAEESIADELSCLIADELGKMTVGDPSLETTQIGTLISEAAAMNVLSLVEQAVNEGALLKTTLRRSGAQLWPILLDHVEPQMKIVDEEVFGPCAPIVRVKNFEQAIDICNRRRSGLQTGVFTRSAENIKLADQMIISGGVMINEGPHFDSPRIPFGGVGDSGIGREGAKVSLVEMSVARTLVI